MTGPFHVTEPSFSVIMAERDTYKAMADSLRADAERYRWLREHDMTAEYCEYQTGNLNGRAVNPLDSTIDAARAKETP